MWYSYCSWELFSVFIIMLFLQRQQAREMEPLLHRTPPLVRSLPPAGRPSASSTRFSGRCTSSSLLLSWRSLYPFHSIVPFLFTCLFIQSWWTSSPPVCSSSLWLGTTLCSGTCWVCGGCSHSCSTAGLYRCRGNIWSPARQTLSSGGCATTWLSWLTTCSTIYR